MQTGPHASELERSFTADGSGQFHEIDPRTGREPAGSGLLARAAAVRQAQEAALRKAVAALVTRGTARPVHLAGGQLDAFVEREMVPRIFDLIERRVVIDESRDDKTYFVTMSVVFDMPAVNEALAELG